MQWLPGPAALPTSSYFAPRSGCALVRVCPGRGLCVCCCRARGLGGGSLGSRVPPPCRCLVRGSHWVLGFGFKTNRRPVYGSRFVTVSKHKRSFSLNRLVAQVSLKNWTYRQSASLHSANPPSRQFAWRGSGAVGVPLHRRSTRYSTCIVTNRRWQWNACNNKSQL